MDRPDRTPLAKSDSVLKCVTLSGTKGLKGEHREMFRFGKPVNTMWSRISTKKRTLTVRSSEDKT